MTFYERLTSLDNVLALLEQPALDRGSRRVLERCVRANLHYCQRHFDNALLPDYQQRVERWLNYRQRGAE